MFYVFFSFSKCLQIKDLGKSPRPSNGPKPMPQRDLSMGIGAISAHLMLRRVGRLAAPGAGLSVVDSHLAGLLLGGSRHRRRLRRGLRRVPIGVIRVVYELGELISVVGEACHAYMIAGFKGLVKRYE